MELDGCDTVGMLTIESIHFLKLPVLFRIMRGPEPIQEDMGTMQRITQDGAATHHRTHSHLQAIS